LRVLIDIKHPAEANFFRPLIRALESRGDTVLVTAHYKLETAAVLTALGIRHVRLSTAWPGPAGIVAAVLVRTGRLLGVARRFRPQVMLARVGAEIGMAGRLLGIPAVSFDENEYAGVQLLVSTTFAHHVCTGMGYEKDLGPKQIRFNALPQLVYTHPSQFKPDAQALRAAGIEPTEPYTVLRLSGWTAIHDLGHGRVSEADALELARALSGHGRVIAICSGGLPAALLPYGHPVPPDCALDLLAFARLYVGEGGSMAAEAACLGTPAVWVSTLRCGYLNILARRYGLVDQVSDLHEARLKAERRLGDPAMRQAAADARRRLLADSEDGLRFMLSVVDRCARRL
jgi:predicted glycosyltransferase